MRTNILKLTGLLCLSLLASTVANAAARTNPDGPTMPTAHYSITTNPPMWLGQKATASDGGAGDLFGVGVAIYGNTAMIGAYEPDYGSDGKGAVYVYTLQNGSWVQTQILTASNGSADGEFGCSVAVEGTTAVIGACGAANGTGTAYVFTETSGTWHQTQELTGSNGSYFGHSVAISGSTILVGSPFTYLPGPIQGAAYVFTNAGGTWTQTAELSANDEANGDEFGWSVSLNGNTALIGSMLDNVNGNTNQGAAYLFTNSGGTWTQTQKLTADDGGSNDAFGSSVSLSGTTAIIGSPAAMTAGVPAGAAYVYENSGGTWSQTQKLMLDNSAINAFGASVNLQGSTVLIGADATSGANFGSGATFIYTDQSGFWQQSQKLYASDGAANDAFGWSVAMNGNNILIGAFQATVAGNPDQGAAYFYGPANLDIAISAPAAATQSNSYTSQIILTNVSGSTSPAATVTAMVPVEAAFVSATASQGSCGQASGMVSCELGQIGGNGGMATASITLKPTGAGGDIIKNTGSIAWAVPDTNAATGTKILTPPIASDGTLAVTEDMPKSSTLSASDPDGEQLTYTIVSPPAHGSAQLSGTVGGAYTYTPSSGYVGSDSFTFKANDGHADSNTATISITVQKKPSSGGGGGGGGGSTTPLGLALLTLIGLAAVIRRRH